MLGKKETVQKTFRLDSKINSNFETLSEVLERTQNDLANVAIQNLLEENGAWLAHNIFVDYAFDFFENCSNVQFEISNVTVDLKYIDDDNVRLKVEIKDENTVIDKYEKLYNAISQNFESKLKQNLRNLFYYIDQNCDEVREYLKNINDYK